MYISDTWQQLLCGHWHCKTIEANQKKSKQVSLRSLEEFLSFFRFKTLFINIFLGLGSQKFLGIVWDLVEFLGLGLGLGLNSENFGIGIGIGIEFENFWDWDWDWDSFFLNVGLGLGLGFFCRPLIVSSLQNGGAGVKGQVDRRQPVAFGDDRRLEL